MVVFNLRLLAALGMTFWLPFAPSLALAEDVSNTESLELANSGEFAGGTAKTAAGPARDTSAKVFGAVLVQVERMPGEVRAQIERGKENMRENTPAPLPDDLGNTREHSAGGLSNTSFSPQEADLLLRIAAAESKLAVPGRLHPDSLFGAALKLGEAKAAPQGTLSSAYESGGDSAAIGYDAKGGTSYGLYQIASNSGTMNRFLKFLASKAPDLFAQLAAAAPDNTGGKHGDMPDTWKRIAAEQGKRFAELQHQFIRESHYEPAAKSISMACGLVVSEKPKALREVLWSTSVQHGVQRATEIFVTAADNLHANGKSAHNFDRAMIEEIYRLRSDHFDGRGVQNAVRKRLQNEKENAVAML